MPCYPMAKNVILEARNEIIIFIVFIKQDATNALRVNVFLSLENMYVIFISKKYVDAKL
jgi:hypothetical protein